MEFLITTIVLYTIILGLGAMSGMFSERSGTINIGIEGMMSMGALGYGVAGNIIYRIDPSIESGYFQLMLICVAVLFGIGFALIHGLATIKIKSDHTISGVALNLLALAIATLLMNTDTLGNPQKHFNFRIQELSLAPSGHFGNILSLKIFLFIIVGIAAWIMLNRTKWGLRFKAVGENPQAVDVAGINVYRIKWEGIIISGALAGLAGGIYFQDSLGAGFNGQTAGLGFLALAVMIMGHWKVIYIIICALIFSVFYSLGVMAVGVQFRELFGDEAGKYGELIRTVPYIVTMISLVALAKVSPGPAAAGINYDKATR